MYKSDIKNDVHTQGRKHFSLRGQIWIRLCKNKSAILGLIIIITIFFMAFIADHIVNYEEDVIQPNVSIRLQWPNSEHVLGTDELGRDVLSRIIYGSRMSLMIGVLAVVFSLTTGVILGTLAAFYGGTIDTVIMRICDIFEGLPSFLMAVVITAAFGTNIVNLMIAVGLGTFSACTRIIRGNVLMVKDQDYVEAGYAMGANDFQIIMFHIMPNCVATIIVQASLRVGSGITTASALSFLGLGVQPPNPEWGAMLSGGRAYLLDSSYLTLFPGLAIMITILAFNMLGDGLRDALDPRLKR